jgi:hypothetical protein
MRNLALLLCLASTLPLPLPATAATSAPTTLVTPFTPSTYLASLDGAVYFDLVVAQDLSLDAFDLTLHSPAGSLGTVDVYVRPGGWTGQSTAIGEWTLAGSGTTTSTGFVGTAHLPLQRAIGLPAGTWGVMLHHRGVMPAYAFAFGVRSCSDGVLTLRGGGASTLRCGGQQFFSRVFCGAVHYTLGGGPYVAATVAPTGSRCGASARSFYEHFLPGAFDLSGQALRLVPNQHGGYDVSRVALPVPGLPVGAQPLPLARGGAVFVPLLHALSTPHGSTNQLLVFADGRVALGGLGQLSGGPGNPDPQALLAGQPTIAACWLDLAPRGPDTVYASTNAATGDVTLTWWQVPNATVATARATFACTCRSNGEVLLVYGNVAQPGDACVVGYSPGAGARDGGAVDLSATPPFATGPDQDGFGLEAEGRPALGTTTALRPVDAPWPQAPRLLVFGWRTLLPGVDLTPFGARDCTFVVDPGDAACLLVTGPAQPLPIGNHPQLLGTRLVAQALAFGPGQVLGSNALWLAIGTV